MTPNLTLLIPLGNKINALFAEHYNYLDTSFLLHVGSVLMKPMEDRYRSHHFDQVVGLLEPQEPNLFSYQEVQEQAHQVD